MTRGFKGILLGVVITAVACGELSTTPGADAGTDGGVISTLRARCDERCTGECSSGECVAVCFPDPSCFPGDYCATSRLCEPRTRPTCDQMPCNADQTCVNEMCVRMTSDCSAGQHCEPPATCDEASDRCTEYVACDIGNACHLGPRGAVCVAANDGLPAQASRCLPGRCRTKVHCPDAMDCEEIGADGTRLGWCR